MLYSLMNVQLVATNKLFTALFTLVEFSSLFLSINSLFKRNKIKLDTESFNSYFFFLSVNIITSNADLSYVYVINRRKPYPFLECGMIRFF